MQQVLFNSSNWNAGQSSVLRVTSTVLLWLGLVQVSRFQTQ